MNSHVNCTLKSATGAAETTNTTTTIAQLSARELLRGIGDQLQDVLLSETAVFTKGMMLDVIDEVAEEISGYLEATKTSTADTSTAAIRLADLALMNVADNDLDAANEHLYGIRAVLGDDAMARKRALEYLTELEAELYDAQLQQKPVIELSIEPCPECPAPKRLTAEQLISKMADTLKDAADSLSMLLRPCPDLEPQYRTLGEIEDVLIECFLECLEFVSGDAITTDPVVLHRIALCTARSAMSDALDDLNDLDALADPLEAQILGDARKVLQIGIEEASAFISNTTVA